MRNFLDNYSIRKKLFFLLDALVTLLLHEKRKISHYSDMASKIIYKIRGWQTKFFSTGGRAVFIRHVLLAMPIHILTTTNPPKGNIELKESTLLDFVDKTTLVSIIGSLGRTCATLMRRVEQTSEILMTRAMLFK